MHINPLVAKANRLARILRDSGSPTSTKEACELWEICSGNHSIGILTAKKLYLKAGYNPFRGFPLERKV